MAGPPGPGPVMVQAGPVGVAVIGCGTISDEYLKNLTSFGDLRVVFCADLDVERAEKQAAAYGVPRAGTSDQALACPDAELVVNLTIPAAHFAVSMAAVAAGKHVWTEKPLALDVASGRRLLAEADRMGVRVGCAPDTVLGAGLQTARRLIAEGAIGVPQAALALFQNPGPESWHPDPEFLFQDGAGPLFDMGPYYLSTLAAVLGPACSVAAVGRRARETRTIGSGPRAGTVFGVDVFTHISALLEYTRGPAATLVLSFDSPLRRYGFVEITGTEATIALPDPNRFDGDIRIRATGTADWTVLPTVPYRGDPSPRTPGGTTYGRGLGVLDLARAVRRGGPVRASGEIGLHVLETMEVIKRSIASRAFEPVNSGFTLPDPLEADWNPAARTI